MDNFVCVCSDYKPEYDKLRERKLKEAEKKKDGKASVLPESVGKCYVFVQTSDNDNVAKFKG